MEKMIALGQIVSDAGRVEKKSRTDGIGRDESLLSAHLHGDNDAFVELYNRHREPLYLYAARMMGSAEQGEDISHEVWERLIRLRENPPQVRNARAFLVTMIRNLCLNQLRRNRRQEPLNHERIARWEAEEEGPNRDLEERAVEALNGLPIKYREVLILNIYSGYDFEEIAVMLQLTPAAVWKRASRGRQEIRKMLEREEERRRGA